MLISSGSFNFFCACVSLFLNLTARSVLLFALRQQFALSQIDLLWNFPNTACSCSFRFDSILDVSVLVAFLYLNSHQNSCMSVSSMSFPYFFSKLIIFSSVVPITTCPYFSVNTNHIAPEYVFIHLLYEPATPGASTLRAPGGTIHTLFLHTIATWWR